MNVNMIVAMIVDMFWGNEDCADDCKYYCGYDCGMFQGTTRTMDKHTNQGRVPWRIPDYAVDYGAAAVLTLKHCPYDYLTFVGRNRTPSQRCAWAVLRSRAMDDTPQGISTWRKLSSDHLYVVLSSSCAHREMEDSREAGIQKFMQTIKYSKVYANHQGVPSYALRDTNPFCIHSESAYVVLHLHAQVQALCRSC